MVMVTYEFHEHESSEEISARHDAERYDLKAMTNANLASFKLLPPEGLKVLESLAWCIGRDDAHELLPPHRCKTYRASLRDLYLMGYRAQRQRMEGQQSAPGTTPSNPT